MRPKNLEDLWEALVSKRRIPTSVRVLDNINRNADIVVNDIKGLTAMKGGDIIVISGRKSYEFIREYLDRVVPAKGVDIKVIIMDSKVIFENIDDLEQKIRRSGVSIIVGVGGGYIIDLAKYLGHRTSIPVVIIPTTLSSNAIISPFSVFKCADGKIRAFSSSMPNYVYIFTDLLHKIPRNHFASGFADTFAKYTAIFDWRLARWFSNTYYDKEIDKLATLALKTLIKEVDIFYSISIESIRELIYAELIDGYLMYVASTTRVVAGSEHLIALALTAIDDSKLHGEYVSLGVIISSYIQGRRWKKVKNILDNVGAPTNIYDLGIEKKQIKQALSMAPSMRDWYTILDIPNEERLEDLLSSCKII